ncbi:hypothetical protein M6B38_245425 [Iris pallida]|uniref:Uncharacterized protein n=1 Tax=Iris pallida TaxID=29817 RepID=A0AAX6DHE4_IRIPA|nr:hypothetical protein M6B38_245425 [Iris pallida]
MPLPPPLPVIFSNFGDHSVSLISSSPFIYVHFYDLLADSCVDELDIEELVP